MNISGKEKYRWIVLAISYFLMISFSISLQALPPLFDNINLDISFTNAQAGSLMGAYAIPGILLPFFIAFLASRFNEKTIILIALGILTAGLIAFSLSNSYTLLLIFRLISGIGATALVVLSPLLVTMYFDESNMGIAMGIFNTAVPTGTVIAANLFGLLGTSISWRYILLGIAAYVALVFILSYFFIDMGEKPSSDEGGEGASGLARGLISNMGLWSLAIIWALTNGQLLAYVTFASGFFQKAGMGLQKAGFLTSLIMLLPIFLSPVIGIIVDRTGWKKRLILGGAIIIGLSFLLLNIGTSGLALGAMSLGLGFTPIPVLVFALLPELVEARFMGLGLGVLTMSSNLGIAAGPVIFGALLDNTGGNFKLGFAILALISIGTLLALWGLKKVHK